FAQVDAARHDLHGRRALDIRLTKKTHWTLPCTGESNSNAVPSLTAAFRRYFSMRIADPAQIASQTGFLRLSRPSAADFRLAQAKIAGLPGARASRSSKSRTT